MVERMKQLSSVVLLGACVTFAACARHADESVTDTAVSGGDVMMPRSDADTAAVFNGPGGAGTDADLMARISAANTAEIDAAKLAEQKATSPQVQEFARMMVSDHTAMSQAGNDIVAKLHLDMKADHKTKDMSEDAAESRKELAEKKGSDFDKKYIDEQVDAHQKVLDMLNDARKDNHSADVVTLIDGAIPKVQAHLDRAKAIHQGIDK